MDFDIEDPRMIQYEELAMQSSIFPPIQNNSYGKATGNLIKSLLNNVTGDKNSNASQHPS